MEAGMAVRGRFAPSPTGRMHLGNVFCALLSWLSAKSRGGEWVLRIEDLDPQRCRREYAMQLMDDLLWLGLQWDGVPVWQSERARLYEECLSRLASMHLTYPCRCSRADIMATQAPHETDGRVVYRGTCRPSSKALPPQQTAEPAAIRVMVPDEEICFDDWHYGFQHLNLAEHCGDYIVRRKDGAWAYQLAVVVDDALMGVTEVIRGRDLLLSSPQQIHLRRLLFPHLPQVQFCHHPLLCNASGQRLCKRDRATDLGVLRMAGVSPQQIIGRLAFLAGLIEEEKEMGATDLLPLFCWDKVPQADITVG